MALPSKAVAHLETARLFLRPISDADGNDLYQVHRDPHVSRLLAGLDAMTRDHSDHLLQEYVEHWTRFRLGFFLVYEKNANSQEPVGRCGLRLTDEQDVELGYCFRALASGRGLATEAASAVIGHAFQDLMLHRLVAFVRPDNARSMRVLGKIGFERAGLIHGPRPLYRFVINRAVPDG